MFKFNEISKIFNVPKMSIETYEAIEYIYIYIYMHVCVCVYVCVCVCVCVCVYAQLCNPFIMIIMI